MVGGELPGHQRPGDRTEPAEQPGQLALGDEMDLGPAVSRCERPGAVDRIGPLDDVGGDPAGAVELGELGDLLERLAAGGSVTSRKRVPLPGGPGVSCSTLVFVVCQSASVAGSVR